MEYDILVNDILNSDDIVEEKIGKALATGALGLGLAMGGPHIASPSQAAEPVPVTKSTQRLPRGIRNNNPGNIEATGNWKAWGGAVDDDGRFIIFDKPEMGTRAIGKILKTYNSRYAINTIEGIINRWAPPQENNTESYIRSVVKNTGLERDKKLDINNQEIMKKLIKAIITHENGMQPYSDDVINKGISLANIDY